MLREKRLQSDEYQVAYLLHLRMPDVPLPDIQEGREPAWTGRENAHDRHLIRRSQRAALLLKSLWETNAAAMVFDGTLRVVNPFVEGSHCSQHSVQEPAATYKVKRSKRAAPGLAPSVKPRPDFPCMPETASSSKSSSPLRCVRRHRPAPRPCATPSRFCTPGTLALRA